MVAPNALRIAENLLLSASALLQYLAEGTISPLRAEDLDGVETLIRAARGELDGSAAAREKKNAQDRERRAKKTAKKPRSIGKAVSRRAPTPHPPLGME